MYFPHTFTTFSISNDPTLTIRVSSSNSRFNASEAEMHFSLNCNFKAIRKISLKLPVFVKCHKQPGAVWPNEKPPQYGHCVPTNENTTRRVLKSVLEESYTSHRESHTWK